VEYLGAESLLVLQAGTASAPASIVVRAAGPGLPRRGDAVGLAWPADAVHAFDRDSGLRLTFS
jgi:hypothetical protein